MAVLQKIANLVLLVAGVMLLWRVEQGVQETGGVDREVVRIVESVATGEEFVDLEGDRIATVLGKAEGEGKGSPICLLRAYQEMVVKENLDRKGIWDMIASGKEFKGVTNCWDYYSLLYYRASVSDNPQKDKALAIIYKLMQGEASKKPTINLPICIYFHAFGAELATKEQLTQIVSQDYKEMSVFVEVDAAQDNTDMYVKYVAGQSQRKIDVHNEKERQGFLGRLAETVIQCPDNSVVLMLDRDSVLITPLSLRIVEAHFAQEQKAEAAVFKSLTKRHQNIEASDAQSRQKSYPVIAFRKSVFAKLQPLISKVQQRKECLNYQHQIFSHTLLSQPPVELSHSEEVILSRSERSPKEEEQLSLLLDG